MKSNMRMLRTNDEIKREVSEIIRSQLKDPRISSITTVIKVDTTNDLKYSKIHVSIMGNDEQKSEVMTGLKNAAGFIRKQIAARINLRNTPEFSFILDDSLEYSIRMSKLISEVNKTSGE